MRTIIFLLLLAVSCLARESEYSLVQGELPILIVAAHGGSKHLPEVPRRQQNNRDPNFSIKKDMYTAELASAYASAIEIECGLKPSLLVSKLHRRMVDLNRPATLAYEHALAKESYQNFHSTLEKELERLLTIHPRVYLLDIHGQARYDTDLIVGSLQGRSLSVTGENFWWGTQGAVSVLESSGLMVSPRQAHTLAPFSGGFITAHYGRHPRVEASQLEHSKKLRFSKKRQAQISEILSRLLVRHLRRSGCILSEG